MKLCWKLVNLLVMQRSAFLMNRLLSSHLMSVVYMISLRLGRMLLVPFVVMIFITEIMFVCFLAQIIFIWIVLVHGLDSKQHVLYVDVALLDPLSLSFCLSFIFLNL